MAKQQSDRNNDSQQTKYDKLGKLPLFGLSVLKFIGMSCILAKLLKGPSGLFQRLPKPHEDNFNLVSNLSKTYINPKTS